MVIERGHKDPGAPTLERNIVIRNRAGAAGHGSATADVGCSSSAALASGAVSGTTEHDQIPGSYFGGLTLVAFLIVPLAGLQASFDVDELALGQILVADFGETVPCNDGMPFGAFLALRPEPLSFQTSSVASEKRQNGVPLAVYFSSGSLPSRPTRITLFTDFAMSLLQLMAAPCFKLRAIALALRAGLAFAAAHANDG